MKRKCLTAACGLLTIACATANADLLSSESFADTGYTVGTLLRNLSSPSPATPGYSGDWTGIDFGNFGAGVLSGSLSYSDGLYASSSGNRIGVPNDTAGGEVTANNSGRVQRLLDNSLAADASTTGTRYVSWLFQSGQETGASTYQMLDLYNTDTTDLNRTFTAGLTTNGGQSGTEYNFGVTETYSSTSVAADTSVHLFVVRFDFSADAASDSVTVWLDPTLGAGDPAGGISVTGQDIAFDRLAISDYEGNSANWDEIRWGTTFDSVTVVPEPSTSALALGGVALLIVGLRRRIRR